MKLTFLGAAHEVTGSCYYLEACDQKILIDCGLEQGRDTFENAVLPVKAEEVDLILLTHAHLDHSGKLPLLYKEGFRGPVYATPGTARLSEIMLLDSAHIQESEAEWKNRKGQRAGRAPVEPMYDQTCARGVIGCFEAYEYGETFEITEGIQVRFTDAGHMLGSSTIELWITEQDVRKKLIFSGDIGNLNQPLINDPVYPEEADYVVMESTYGDRSHEAGSNYAIELAKIMQKTFDRGGNVVIPAFAIGRTQEILYLIRQIKAKKMIKGHDGFEVWVDSPLAVEATEIFRERMYSDFDEEAMELLGKGMNPLGFDGLKVSVTSEESKRINHDPRCKVIISASGMCDAGRIKHHLKHNLWRPESTILFSGYQSKGTLGRTLQDGASEVRIFGEEIKVRAEISRLPGISGHADDQGLLRWIRSIRKKPQSVFVTHGDDQVCELFRNRLEQELGISALAPYSGSVLDLVSGNYEYEAEPVPVRDKKNQ